MVTWYPLYKYFKVGTEYKTPDDKFYVIEAIGTDSGTAAHLKLDRGNLGDIIDEIAPLFTRTTNLLGPLKLGPLFYVIPPKKTFTVENEAGKGILCIGRIGLLAPGEAIPSPFLDRYEAQFTHYLTYVEGEVKLAVDEKWAADRELKIFEKTAGAYEWYKLNYPVMVGVTGGTVNPGYFGVRFMKDTELWDVFAAEIKPHGIDVLKMPKPPAETTEMQPFIIKEPTIIIEKERTWKWLIKNVSGELLSPTAGAAWTVSLRQIVEFKRLA